MHHVFHNHTNPCTDPVCDCFCLFFFKELFILYFKTLAVLSTKNVIANQLYSCL